ncbi:TPA: 50S ribosomal protein L19 [Candidatus Dependentiae bacterium]|nr:MAG: 50S ribosomal protein L19 [candidate division TM6 bacterium GW2011_GWF2_43_87]HBL98485.1 50S ribosomal protein L19 [Candidatus Dependentiae bacterium]
MRAKQLNKETLLQYGLTERNFPKFSPGDAIRVAQRIKEGDKERIQYFEGDVIAVHNNGIGSTFTIRRIASNGIAVERIFPIHSPKIDGIEFLHHGDVRRAKLYYMRDRIGRGARVKELVLGHQAKREAAAQAAAQPSAEKAE